jgi:predicted HNH restriction endonuclease
MTRTYRPGERLQKTAKPPEGKKSDRAAGDIVRALRAEKAAEGEAFDYREASIKLHGTHCARCAKDFTGKDRKQITVHHKDFNHNNNPRDGSNWENLCVYCHEDVHSRHLVEDSINPGSARSSKPPEREPTITLSLADKLKEAMEKKKQS